MKLIAWVSILILFLISPLRAESGEGCRRIITLAPSITEVVFALGLGPGVVGVSNFDRFPPETISLPKIGGLLDPNLEAIVRLQPTIVLALVEHQGMVEKLRALEIPVVTVDHRSVAGIVSSLTAIGKECKREHEGAAEVTRLRREMAEISDRISTLPLVKTMVVVGREGEGSKLTSIYISGEDGYYNDLLRLGGGENVYSKQTSAFGSLSDEGIMKLNPDAIIEISPPLDSGRASREEIAQSWKRLKRISAVKSGRILILDEDYTSIPGPRFPLLLRRISEFLHPVEKVP